MLKEIGRINIHKSKVYFVTPDEINVEPTQLKTEKAQSFESLNIMANTVILLIF